jgi:hypothetical protein
MTKGIEVFQDLTIRGSHDAIRAALAQPDGGDWHRDHERESSMMSDGSTDLAMVFAHPRTSELPACVLTMLFASDGFRVTNIVPVEVGELSIREYNSLLNDFRHRILDAVAKAGDFELEVTPSIQTIDHWIGAPAATALRRFSSLANKSTGAAHPLDRDRWFDFVIAVYHANEAISTDLLARWLQEVEGWSSEFAYELAGEYETLLSFLKHYEERRH